MTAISTLIAAQYTTHATDSFLTELQSDGSRKIIEDQQTKIVRVQPFRGAMGYYGLARYGTSWSTLDWLRQRANDAARFACAEDFARDLAKKLNSELNARSFPNPLDKGVGIHFTAYERVGDYWVPELFHIRNWTDPSYSALFVAGVVVTRETYAILKDLPDRSDSHRDPLFRMAVHYALHSDGIIFRFNNGDPVLFNPIANALLDTAQRLAARRHLRQPADANLYLSLARRPVEVVSKFLADLSLPEMRLIGGKPHDLAIAPNGTTESTTGD